MEADFFDIASCLVPMMGWEYELEVGACGFICGFVYILGHNSKSGSGAE
eukprot:CAMPEP_0201616836 /NCGR_PEP_ID=MMETSP0492-20130828/34885_1 /ASSEMBLY_ACC=CAM_ASM_000837 /TAXON_ID=420259 /ORGANISM="Thalassiosira gravida, Strain GMp14c1" /LENGTH=48 /DNA_ID= /DNA_START= /DNA_END= /DNA_ORIENTATION=